MSLKKKLEYPLSLLGTSFIRKHVSHRTLLKKQTFYMFVFHNLGLENFNGKNYVRFSNAHHLRVTYF